MKYRELSPNEIEAYNVGYKVGNRQIVITDIEWESENEHKIYRKGYMAGLMDYKRKVSNVDNVSNVSNVEIATPTTSITSTTPIGISISNSISKKNISIDTKFNAGFQGWKFDPALLTVAKKHWTADTIRKIEIDFSCQEYNTETSIQELLERYPADVSKGFKKPTIDEIKAYCQERNNSVDPDKFYNYYASNGWKVGKNPMKDWKAAVRTWEKSGYNTQKKPNINLDACEDNFLDDTPYWLKNKKDSL